MLSVNKSCFIFSFPIVVSFISFSCLTAWTRAAGTMVNRSGKGGQSYLVLDLRGKGSNTSQFMSDVKCKCLGMPFIRFRNLFYISSLLIVFINHGYWMSDAFFCIYLVFFLFDIYTDFHFFIFKCFSLC